MSATLRRYAVGRWGSLWASQPYMSHRILIDLPARKVIAGEQRFCKEWRYMSMGDLECMQQELDEMFGDIFDTPHEYGFQVMDEPPHWALYPWPWPRIPALTDDEDEP